MLFFKINVFFNYLNSSQGFLGRVNYIGKKSSEYLRVNR